MSNVSHMTEIRCKKVTFYSKGDEDTFFGWAHNIPAIKEVFGDVEDIVLLIGSVSIEDSSLRELIALLYRYNLPLQQLAIFKNPSNQEWFQNENKFWYSGVFGNNG